jgi:hypothetical protein
MTIVLIRDRPTNPHPIVAKSIVKSAAAGGTPDRSDVVECSLYRI